MSHRLIGLLCRGVDRELGIRLLSLSEGHGLICAIDRARRGDQQVPDLLPLSGLHHIKGPHEVALDVSTWILEGVPDTGLGR